MTDEPNEQQAPLPQSLSQQEVVTLARQGVREMQGVLIAAPLPTLLPPGVVVRTGECILELGCGIGRWVVPMARENPHLQVIGVDSDPTALDTLRDLVRASGVSNLQVHLGTLGEPIEGIAPGSVALIRAHHLGVVVPPSRWPDFLAQCAQWVQPGGTIWLCERAWPMTTSPLYQYATRQISSALYQAGESFSVDGFDLGLIPIVGRLLREAGFEVDGMQGLVEELAGDERMLRRFSQGVCWGWKQVQPLLMQMLLFNHGEWRGLQDQLTWELERPEFRAVVFSHLIWASKPLRKEDPHTNAVADEIPVEGVPPSREAERRPGALIRSQWAMMAERNRHRQ